MHSQIIAITIDGNLKIGLIQKNTVFGKDICLLKNYSEDRAFIMEKLEIYFFNKTTKIYIIMKRILNFIE